MQLTLTVNPEDKSDIAKASGILNMFSMMDPNLTPITTPDERDATPEETVSEETPVVTEKEKETETPKPRQRRRTKKEMEAAREKEAVEKATAAAEEVKKLRVSIHETMAEQWSDHKDEILTLLEEYDVKKASDLPDDKVADFLIDFEKKIA